MIKVYVMATCPDCTQVKAEAANDPRFELIDLGEHVRHLKAFLALRDTHPYCSVSIECKLSFCCCVNIY